MKLKSVLIFTMLVLISFTAFAQDNAWKFRGMVRLDYPDAPTLYGSAEIIRHEMIFLDVLYLSHWEINLVLEFPDSMKDIDYGSNLACFITDGRIYIQSPTFRLTFIPFEQWTRDWISVRNGITLVPPNTKYRSTLSKTPDGKWVLEINRILPAPIDQKGR